MKKLDLLTNGTEIWRVLECKEDSCLVIDCRKLTMPQWVDKECFVDFVPADENALSERMTSSGTVDGEPSAQAWQRYTMIAGILPVIGDKDLRSVRIREAADFSDVSRQTVRAYLCKYLVYQDVRTLAIEKPAPAKELTEDQKNMRWAINKYYYNRYKNPLTTAYIKMLQERYTDDAGKLLPEHPSMHQFRYFFNKYKKMQICYISRDGISSYQRNNRPLLGDGVQEYAPAVGTAMNDGTVCDIYLVDDAGNVIGRPLLVVSIDAYSGLCLGYFIGWEGGVYSLRGLITSILEDKVEHCRKHGIMISPEEWPVQGVLPGTMISDRGSEYISENFAQLTELGPRIISLPGFRPDLKGPVEQLINLIQETYEQHLHGYGTLEFDFAERGAKDYRKEACLTLSDFEKIVIHCIVDHNAHRIAEDFPYTEEMLDAGIRPYANALYEYGKTLPGACLIPCSIQDAIKTLLPRTIGKFTRKGLKVNGMRYKASGFTEEFLRGGSVTCAYNPDDSSAVWLIREGHYILFTLIEKRFEGKPVEKVVEIRKRQRALVRAEEENRLQSRVDLANSIDAITGRIIPSSDANLKNIRETRQRERDKRHVDYWNERGLG